MNPLPVGQTVQISDAATLAPHVQQLPAVLSPDHLTYAGKSAVIRTVYVTTHARTQYFFYALDGSPLLWPHAAFDMPRGRRLTVNHTKPHEPRAPRNINVYLESTPARIPDPKLYVGGLPFGMGDAALVRLFRRFGDVEVVQLIIDKMTDRSRGFGFVKFRDATDANNAAASLNASEVADTGEMASVYRTEKYLAWLRRSWNVTAANIREYSEEGHVATRIITILEQSSQLLAQCVADYPSALETIEWRDFERMLAAVFEGLGFGVTCGRGSKDGGVDLRLTTASNTYVVQAKHWVSGKRVGGSTLQATVTLAMLEGHGGAIVLSTSGFTRNAVTAITSIQRAQLRIGERWEIHSLCRTYVRVDQGLLQPLDPDAVLRTHTRSL
jgi:HJR/Mrr/RecB family endonuclease